MSVRASSATTAIAPFNILDVYTGSAAAYSLRKLRGAYSGAAVRVRRSNDNAEQDIGFDALGNFDELSLVSFVGVNSGFVTTWYDQSGNVRNATQAIAANQPRIVNAGAVDKVNGRAAPTYSSASAGLIVSSLTSSVFHVFSAANLVGASYAYDGISASPRPYWNRSSSAQEDAGNASAIFPAATGFSVRSRLYPTGIAYINNVAKANSVGQGIGVGVNGLTIGNRFSLTESAGGSIPELISYFTDQSSSRATIEANIMSYYGIS